MALSFLSPVNADTGLTRTRKPSPDAETTAQARVAWALGGQPAQVVATAIQIFWAR